MKRARLFACLSAALLILSCHGKDSDAKDAPPPVGVNPATPAKDQRESKLKGPEMTFSSQYADGKPFHSEDFVGDKIIFGFFSIDHRDSADFLKSLQKLKPLETQYHFHIFAVSLDPGKGAEVLAFLKQNNIDLPALLDSATLELATKLAVENQVALIGLDNHHVPSFGFKKYVFNQMPDGETQFLDELKKQLNVTVQSPTKPYLGVHPLAPDFDFTTLDGKSMKLSQLRGKVVHLVFFSPRCPHCQHEMSFLRDKVYPIYHKDGYEVLALSVLGLQDETLKLYQSFNFPWPVVDDSHRRVRKMYSNEQGVPENYLIDKEGRIRFTSQGYAEGRDEIYIMQLKSLLGQPQPPTLSDQHFSGSDTCMICHEDAHTQWETTPHAHAWESLVLKGEDHNVECVACHSLGMNDPRGYKTFTDPKSGKQVASVPPWLQGVQCEQCHGVGGPHTPSSKEIKREDMKATCLKCHTPEFSLNFDFDDRIKKIDHSNKAAVLKLTPEERLELLKKVAKKPQDLFNTKIRYVGSDQCVSCHTDIHKNWLASMHGKAFEGIRGTDKEKDPDELARRTVGYGEAGGYQEAMSKGLEGVGCESCHGPGGEHVISKKKSDTRGLGADCPFCVVEQICLSCHNADKNFNIYKGLDWVKQEHGLK